MRCGLRRVRTGQTLFYAHFEIMRLAINIGDLKRTVCCMPSGRLEKALEFAEQARAAPRHLSKKEGHSA